MGKKNKGTTKQPKYTVTNQGTFSLNLSSKLVYFLGKINYYR